jgi:hypothetical protein
MMETSTVKTDLVIVRIKKNALEYWVVDRGVYSSPSE